MILSRNDIIVRAQLKSMILLCFQHLEIERVDHPHSLAKKVPAKCTC